MSHITDAEWQIMRALWETSPRSAVEIAQSIQPAKGWSLTTVKTFLSRLVQKKMVRFEEAGKMFLYHPIGTERDCVTMEMKAVIRRLYGGVVLAQTERFEFYGEGQPSSIDALANHLETEAIRLEERYRIRFQEKQQVYLYSSLSRLHSALGRHSMPDWLRAGWVWDMIHLAPEECFTDISIESAAVQVYVEKILFEINPHAPYWLTQGIRTLESRILTQERLQTALGAEVATLSPDAVKRLSTDIDLFKIRHGYELSALAVEFMEERFGFASVRTFVKAPEDYVLAFQMDETTFWEEWVTFAKLRHSEGEKDQ